TPPPTHHASPTATRATVVTSAAATHPTPSAAVPPATAASTASTPPTSRQPDAGRRRVRRCTCRRARRRAAGGRGRRCRGTAGVARPRGEARMSVGSVTASVRGRLQAEFLPRALHPGAWWVWALGLATAASRTTNPFVLLLVVAVAGYVVAA